jgi:hypothetical protein
MFIFLENSARELLSKNSTFPSQCFKWLEIDAQQDWTQLSQDENIMDPKKKLGIQIFVLEARCHDGYVEGPRFFLPVVQ